MFCTDDHAIQHNTNAYNTHQPSHNRSPTPPPPHPQQPSQMPLPNRILRHRHRQRTSPPEQHVNPAEACPRSPSANAAIPNHSHQHQQTRAQLLVAQNLHPAQTQDTHPPLHPKRSHAAVPAGYTTTSPALRASRSPTAVPLCLLDSLAPSPVPTPRTTCNLP